MSKMYRDDISDEAIDVLSDLFMLSDFAKKQDISLVEAVGVLIEGFTETETGEYINALRELKEQKFIDIKYTEDVIGQPEGLLKRISILPKGKLYHFKYLERTGMYSMKRSEHEKTVDDAIRKFTNSATYILIIAILSVLVDLLNAFANLYTALR